MAQNKDGASREILWSKSTIVCVGMLFRSAGDDDIVFSNTRIPENGNSANTCSVSRKMSIRDRISIGFKLSSIFGDNRDECINEALTAGHVERNTPGVSPWTLCKRRTIVDGGRAVKIVGDTVMAVKKSTSV